MGKRGRPKMFAGPVIAFKVSAMLRLQIQAAAQERGMGISEIVRATLEEKFGNHVEKPKSAKVAY